MRRYGGPIAGIGLVLGLLAVLVAPPLAARRAVAPHLDILSAAIREALPLDLDTVAGRHVILEIEVAAPPSCDGGTPTYGFLVDADRDPGTSFASRRGSRSQRRALQTLSRLGLRNLGIDANLSLRCDPSTGSFASPLGPVLTVTDPSRGTTSLQLHTVVERLPSVRFHWVAFAAEGNTLVRLPRQPTRRALRRDGEGHATWSTFEIARF